MKPRAILHLTLGAAAGFALGYWAGGPTPQATPDPSAPLAARVAEPAAPSAATGSSSPSPWASAPWSAQPASDSAGAVLSTRTTTVADMWRDAVAATGQPDEDTLDRLRLWATEDGQVLDELIRTYDQARTPQERDALRGLLASVQRPEVARMAHNLALSGDPQQRREGFELIRDMGSASPESRQLVRQALQAEQDPVVLTEALQALTPTVVDAGEGAAVASQLRELTHHVDPGVRANSLLQLSQWDTSGSAEPQFYAGLHDSATQVRQSAVTALAVSPVRSDRLKDALLTIVRNPAEDPQVRASALEALAHFPLGHAEHASYLRAHQDVRALLPE